MNLQEFVNQLYSKNYSKYERAKLTKEFLSQTPYTREEFNYLRVRHPYYKKLKNKGSYERNKRRLEKYNFNPEPGTKRRWTFYEVQLFLQLTDSKPCTDLAEMLNRSLAALQSKRRMLKRIKALNIDRNRWEEILLSSEKLFMKGETLC